jgi:hypothetical protein
VRGRCRTFQPQGSALRRRPLTRISSLRLAIRPLPAHGERCKAKQSPSRDAVFVRTAPPHHLSPAGRGRREFAVANTRRVRGIRRQGKSPLTRPARSARKSASPHRGEAIKCFQFSRCAFCLRPECCRSPPHESFASKQIRGGGAPIGADPPRTAQMRGWVTAPYACGPHLAVRRASCAKTRSPFGAPPRLSPKPCRLGSVRSRASWSRTTDPRPRQPAPGRPATRPAGRVSEPPADEVTSPVPGTAPARINRRHRLTSLKTSEMGFAYFVPCRATSEFSRSQPSN